MYVVFYKDQTIMAKLIRWWTKSNYNHIEFYDGINLIGIGSEGDCVRKKENKLNPNKWDIYKLINVDEDNLEKHLLEFYNRTKGSAYDKKGFLLSNFFRKKEHDTKKYTCSEYVINALDYHFDFIYPKWYQEFSPQDVLEVLEDKKLIKEVKL